MLIKFANGSSAVNIYLFIYFLFIQRRCHFLGLYGVEW